MAASAKTACLVLSVWCLPLVANAQTPHAVDPSSVGEIPDIQERESLEDLEEGVEDRLSPLDRLSEPGLGGVLVDRTITMIGKTFYRQFSQLSTENPILANSHLSIHERPSARWGSLIWIAEGNQIVFEATLPPRMSDVDRYAELAVQQVSETILHRAVIQAFEKNEDLADEEL